jgi:hypothetical protein
VKYVWKPLHVHVRDLNLVLNKYVFILVSHQLQSNLSVASQSEEVLYCTDGY